MAVDLPPIIKNCKLLFELIRLKGGIDKLLDD